MTDIDLITDHVTPATIERWQDQLASGDRRAVSNFQTALRYGAALDSGTIVDYVKDPYTVRVNDAAPEDRPNWSAAERHVEAMVAGKHDRTCLRCDRPVYTTYTEKLCRQHFLERVGPAWTAELDENGLNSMTMEE